MEAFAVSVFSASLLGIFSLFGLKSWEEKRGSQILPSLRARADQGALVCKAVLLHSKSEFAKLRPALIRLSRMLLHDLALWLAAFLRACEQKAHAFADFVSHKRNFERKVSTNEFLKKVGARKTDRSAKKAENDLDSKVVQEE